MKVLTDTGYARFNFHEFVRQSWHVIEGNTPFIDGLHVKALCEHLEGCYARQIKRFVINIPPRTAKSNIVSIMFPAWVWLHNPAERFMVASYAFSLSLEHSLKCRRLIESEWYQERWGHLVKLQKDNKNKGYFETTATGARIATSVGATPVGKGANIFIVDDGNSTEDAYSEVKREAANIWWSQFWSTRMNNPTSDVSIMLQQRLNAEDMTGYLLKNDVNNEYVRLILPMEFDSNKKCRTVPLMGRDKPWEDWRTKDGELLMPLRFSDVEIGRLKRELGSIGYAGQYQQSPQAQGGNIIKEEWFSSWKSRTPPRKFLKIIQSIDTAFKPGQDNDYSVCTTWGLFSSKYLLDQAVDDPHMEYYNCIILLSMWRDKVGYPDLRERMFRLYENYLDKGVEPVKKEVVTNVSDIVLVEDRASGISLLQDFYARGVKNVLSMNPKDYGDKVTRVHMTSKFIENGLIYLPTKAPEFTSWMQSGQTLIDECLVFPNGKHDDIVDTLTQVLLYCEEAGLLKVTHDPKVKAQLENDLSDFQWQ